MPRSSAHVRPVNERYVAYCMGRAEYLRVLGLSEITPASVAHLLGHSAPDRRRSRVTMTSPDERCQIMARILRATGSEDAHWHHVEVMEAYRLRQHTTEALRAMDPAPPRPPQPLPENLDRLNQFSRLLAAQTQSAPNRG